MSKENCPYCGERCFEGEGCDEWQAGGFQDKPYFAKYLPVEGEIKIGDRVESESSGKQKVLVTGITKRGDYITDEPDFYEPDSYFVLPKKKAKKFSKQLFLCSRDIQVGDTVKMKFSDGLKDWECSNVGRLEAAKHNGSFKVIGGISSEAKWVKEGDEFDEDEIAFAIHAPWEEWEQVSYEAWLLEYTFYKNIKVKGHCGHFH